MHVKVKVKAGIALNDTPSQSYDSTHMHLRILPINCLSEKHHPAVQHSTLRYNIQVHKFSLKLSNHRTQNWQPTSNEQQGDNNVKGTSAHKGRHELTSAGLKHVTCGLEHSDSQFKSVKEWTWFPHKNGTTQFDHNLRVCAKVCQLWLHSVCWHHTLSIISWFSQNQCSMDCCSWYFIVTDRSKYQYHLSCYQFISLLFHVGTLL